MVDHLLDIYILFTFKFYMVVVYALFTDLSSMGFIPSVSPCRNLWKWWQHITTHSMYDSPFLKILVVEKRIDYILQNTLDITANSSMVVLFVPNST